MTPQQAEDTVRSLGLVFSNTFLYGVEHGVTTKAVSDAFALISSLMEGTDEISFNINDDDLIVNGHHVELKNPLMRMFVTQLTGLDVASFAVLRGMDEEMFGNLLELLNAKPDEVKQLGGFAKAVQVLNLENVRARRVTYQQVDEDEVVVGKEEIEKAPKDMQAVSDQIVSFLKGDDPVDDDETVEQIKEVAKDEEKLGDLIMQAADVREDGVDMDGGESVGNVVVGCLRKVYDGLSKDPSMKTKKGRKALEKTLNLLEGQVIKRMEAKGLTPAGPDAQEITEAMDAMRDELTIDSLAVEYMKKRKAIDQNEKRILRFIKTKGLDALKETDLRDKLEESGLTQEQWDELLSRSGISRSVGSGGDKARPTAEQLSALLDRMEHLGDEGDGGGAEPGGSGSGDGPSVNPDQLHEVLADVSQEVTDIVMQTQEKIRELVAAMHDDEKDFTEYEKRAKKEGRPAPKVSRKKLMETLAEIGQELCQPLAVVNCTVDMLMSQSLGEINEPQVDMLKLAAESTEKMKQIADSLMEISGLPDTMSPDAEVQESLYTK